MIASTVRRLARLLQHRRYDEADVRRVLPPAAWQRLEARVKASEQGHSGEIRLCIEGGLPTSYLWRDATPRARAVALFGKLRVWDTEHNNGVLVYLLLAEHAIEIVADRGLARRVAADEWQSLAARMGDDFRAGRFEDGLGTALGRVDELLRLHFPLAAGEANPNELPDAPYVGD